MESPISTVIQQICEEKDISFETVLETVKQALAAAYRKDFGQKNQNIQVEFDPETSQTRVFDVKVVVEDMEEEKDIREETKKKEKAENEKEEKKKGVKDRKEEETEKDRKEEETEEEERKFNPRTEITLSEAKIVQKGKDSKKGKDPKIQILRKDNLNSPLTKGDKGGCSDPISITSELKEVKGKIKINDIIKTELEVPVAYGRMAAQSAKQVIIQKLREAEKESLYNKFKEKEGKVLIGVVQRKEGPRVLVDLEKLTAVIPPLEQIREEQYCTGQRIRIYVLEVRQTSKGPEVILSRTHPEIVRELFHSEVPEVGSGGVEIKTISREAGSRTKIAVMAKEKNIDPIGSCVGQRGSRVQIIISELGGEKIDIIQYDEDVEKFISQALSPAKVLSVDLNKKEKIAKVNVKEDQYSLAIGRGGQNVRLASQLTGWKIEIKQVEKDAGDVEDTGDN